MTEAAPAFQREGRYIVLKRSHLQPSQWNGLRALLDTHRINPVDAVVVEADWPEYEPVWDMIETRVSSDVECHGLDTPSRVCFYEQDFYVLSNFSAFSILWSGVRFDTSEHLYHWLKFAYAPDDGPLGLAPLVANQILNAPSAHEAFKIAEANRDHRHPQWDDMKVDRMRHILRAKADQHEYVRRKLLATGDRELVENSWRDDYWGWGPNRDGQNMLGKLWMEVRAELRAGGAA